jgi:hypothetical protein
LFFGDRGVSVRLHVAHKDTAHTRSIASPRLFQSVLFINELPRSN